MKPTVVGGGDVNAADFCNKPVFDTLTQESVRLLGPYSNCWHADPQIDPRHRIQVDVKGNASARERLQRVGPRRVPDAARRLGPLGRRDGALDRRQEHRRRDDQLGHPRQLGHRRGSRHHDPARYSSARQGPTRSSGEIYTAFDAVDNCTGEGPLGGFSTVFGNLSTTDTTIGPFDPIYPRSTLLSNGKVDAGDAPMPAAQIDVTIHANNAADPTDIGGVGYLYPSYKTEVYSRDGLGSAPNGDLADPVKAHNFYAPFYSQYIPATARPTDGERRVRRRTAQRHRRVVRLGRLPRVPRGPARTATGRSRGPAAATAMRTRSACSRRSCRASTSTSGRFRTATTPSRSTPTRAARPT